MCYTTNIWIFYHKFFSYLITEILVLECLYWDRHFWCRWLKKYLEKQINGAVQISIEEWRGWEVENSGGTFFGTQEYLNLKYLCICVEWLISDPLIFAIWEISIPWHFTSDLTNSCTFTFKQSFRQVVGRFDFIWLLVLDLSCLILCFVFQDA